jgi:hypothetical protein
MWTSESNTDNNFDSFSSSVGSAESSGNWREDYKKCCENNKIEACPFFKVAEVESVTTSCKLINTDVDLASWRAMIVASGMKNTTIKEIVCHNVRLKKQHLVDLVFLMKLPDVIVSLKLDYIDFVSEGEGEEATTLAGALLPLLVEGGQLKSLSLKGCGLDKVFTSSFGDILISMTCLEGINLAENNIDDESLSDVFAAFPYCVCLRQISLKKNPITGRGLQGGIQDLVQGRPVGATGEASMKNLQKVVADKNKAIQAANKSRKKAGQEELRELPAPADRVISVSGEDNKVLNKIIELLDFSYCCFEVGAMTEFVAAAALACQGGRDSPEGTRPLSIQVRGVDKEVASALVTEGFSGILVVQC